MPWDRHARRCTLSGCLLCHVRSKGNRPVKRIFNDHGVSPAKKNSYSYEACAVYNNIQGDLLAWSGKRPVKGSLEAKI